MTPKPNRADLLGLFERLLKPVPCRIEITETCGEQEETSVIENGEDYAVIPLHVARYVLDLATQAPWPKGRRTESKLTAQYREYWVRWWALRRKRQLEDGGLSATAALRQAAKEACDHFRLSVSAETVADRMQRKRSR
jgi:hypothetical protein